MSTMGCAHRTPYSEFDIKILDDSSGSFESRIRTLIKTTKQLLEEETEQKRQLQVTYNAGSLLRLSDYTFIIASAITAWEDFLQPDNQESLLRALASEKDQSMARENLQNMSDYMKIINRNVIVLNDTYLDDFKSKSRTSIVHAMHNALGEIVNRLDNANSIFRRHALLSVPTLFTLATIISAFEPVMASIVPGLGRHTCQKCKIYEILFEYRAQVAQDRLNQIRASKVDQRLWNEYPDGGRKGYRNVDSRVENFVVDVLILPWSYVGYSETETVRCIRNRDRQSSDDIYLIDDANDESYFAGLYNQSSVEWEDCFVDYMKLVRHRVEKAFEDPLQLTWATCFPQPPTG